MKGIHGVLALALLAGCNLTPAKTAGVSEVVSEGVIGGDRGKLHVSVGGRSFSLVGADGKPLPDAQIQVAGKTYGAQAGKLYLPEAALAALQQGGGFVALVPGYLPRRVADADPNEGLRAVEALVAYARSILAA